MVIQVNRLTRELSMLRAAQNASVVSNASSTSAGLPDAADHSANHMLSGPSHPTPSQRQHHRSSSSTSTRSFNASTVGGIAGSISSGITPSSTADRSRPAVPRQDSIPISLSRQNSMTGSRRSGTSSPAPPSSYPNPDQFPHFYQQRPTLSQYREPSSGNVQTLNHEHGQRSDSVTSVPTTGRYEETAYHRHELEAVKRENESLKRRIRELERTLRARRQSDASRTRSVSLTSLLGPSSKLQSSLELNIRRWLCHKTYPFSSMPNIILTHSQESVSTTASISGVGRGREREKDNEEDSVRVGESARSSGVPRWKKYLFIPLGKDMVWSVMTSYDMNLFLWSDSLLGTWETGVYGATTRAFWWVVQKSLLCHCHLLSMDRIISVNWADRQEWKYFFSAQLSCSFHLFQVQQPTPRTCDTIFEIWDSRFRTLTLFQISPLIFQLHTLLSLLNLQILQTVDRISIYPFSFSLLGWS
jgi:hypothetical protein